MYAHIKATFLLYFVGIHGYTIYIAILIVWMSVVVKIAQQFRPEVRERRPKHYTFDISPWKSPPRTTRSPSTTTSLIVTIHPLHSGLRGEDTVQASGKSLPSRLTGGEGGLSPTNFVTQSTEFILTSVLWILNNGGRIYLDLRFWAT